MELRPLFVSTPDGLGADEARVKGLDKLTPIRLAEVLTQRGLIQPDAIADALYAHDRYREPFTEILTSAGHITEWDLAKLVVEHFQLPFIMSGNYTIQEDAKNRLSKETLFANLIVPLDLFDHVMTIVMPILTPFEVLQNIQKDRNVSIYPFVGLPSENRTVLAEMFPEFKDWYTRYQQDCEKRRKAKSAKANDGEDDWTRLFDSADAAVRDGLEKR